MYKICIVLFAIAVICTVAVPVEVDQAETLALARSRRSLCDKQCVLDCKIQGYIRGGYCIGGSCVCRQNYYPQEAEIPAPVRSRRSLCDKQCVLDCKTQGYIKGGYCIAGSCVCRNNYYPGV